MFLVERNLTSQPGRKNSAQLLSAREAADILNISRPYLICLLEQGEIPFKNGQVLAKDVFDYKKMITDERLSALNELAAQAQELGMGYE